VLAWNCQCAVRDVDLNLVSRQFRGELSRFSLDIARQHLSWRRAKSVSLDVRPWLKFFAPPRLCVETHSCCFESIRG
jgi:hypothetical protein